jgi:outer membrane lipoprotein-sorting protein
LANGSHIDRTTTELLVQDEQGRYRRETTGPGRRIVVTDPVALVSYMIDEKSKTVRKVAMLPPGAQASVSGSPDGSPLEIARSTARRTPNTVVEDLGTRYINGVSAQGARTITTIPVESIGNDQELRVITERWYSNDIQAVVKSISSDPRSAVTTYELTNIVCAPPDVALFRIPAGYSITGSGNNSDSLRVTSPVTKAGTKK